MHWPKRLDELPATSLQLPAVGKSRDARPVVFPDLGGGTEYEVPDTPREASITDTRNLSREQLVFFHNDL